MDISEGQRIVELATRLALLTAIPCFAKLTPNQSQLLASLMEEVRFKTGEMIVVENDIVDSIYIIVNGKAEVTREVTKLKKAKQVPIALLQPGETIGLNEAGFYSETGTRTATVTALTDMLVLKLPLEALHHFLHEHYLESTMYAASLQMMRMLLIKASLPFAKLSHKRLQWLAEHVEEVHVKAGTVIFKQGDTGDRCYLIRHGAVEIAVSKDHEIHRLTILKAPMLFGEATLITSGPRNATAIAIEDCELLELRHEYLSELIESEQQIANMFMTLMVDRSRPMRNPAVSVHERKTLDGQVITILKNPEKGTYFKLSKEGAYIWEQLNGERTLQEITLDLAENHHVFAPNIVAAIISKLTRAGFIINLEWMHQLSSGSHPYWVRAMTWLNNVMTKRFTFLHTDEWVTKTYNQSIKYFFTKTGQFILAFIALIGFFAFIERTDNIIAFFSGHHITLLLLLGLLPFALLEVVLHELAHAYAVKYYQREVHYIGVGWHWFLPVAFTDTSDMWLSDRKSRMVVNVAGIYTDMIIAGLAAIFIYVIPNSYIEAMLWLAALYAYIAAFRVLSPMEDVDGYFLLSDWLEKNHLREAAVTWLLKKSPLSLLKPSQCKNDGPEVSYWCAVLLYLIMLGLLILYVQSFLFKIIGFHTPHPVAAMILPIIIVIFTSLSAIAEIRSKYYHKMD